MINVNFNKSCVTLVILIVTNFTLSIFTLKKKIIMAEIKIEQKKIVTIENYISGTNDTNLLGVKENNSTVAAFVSFVENDTSKVGIDSDYTNEPLFKLTAATDAMAGEIGYDIRADLEKLKQSIVLTANEPFETSLAKNTRIAADNSTTALQNMQLAKYPWLSEEVDELKSALTAINPLALKPEQKDAVMNYFTKAANLLDKMNL